jgi:hypothetical protein
LKAKRTDLAAARGLWKGWQWRAVWETRCCREGLREFCLRTRKSAVATSLIEEAIVEARDRESFLRISRVASAGHHFMPTKRSGEGEGLLF